MNDYDSKGSTPLHWACYISSEQSVNFLLKYESININCIDKGQGMTPLHLAVISGNYKIVKRLLSRGIDRSIKDYKNRTALDLAI